MLQTSWNIFLDIHEDVETLIGSHHITDCFAALANLENRTVGAKEVSSVIELILDVKTSVSLCEEPR